MVTGTTRSIRRGLVDDNAVTYLLTNAKGASACWAAKGPSLGYRPSWPLTLDHLSLDNLIGLTRKLPLGV